MEHGDTAKRLSALDASYSAAAQEVTRLQGMVQAVQAAQVTASTGFITARAWQLGGPGLLYMLFASGSAESLACV